MHGHSHDHSHHGHQHHGMTAGAQELRHEAPAEHSGRAEHGGHAPGPGPGHHGHMVADFRRRFWVSLALTVPVVALSEVVQGLLGVRFSFPGDRWIQPSFASAIYVYGGWPFLAGLTDELRRRRPGMMTLAALAIPVAFVYSAAGSLGLPGLVFF